MTLIDRIWEVAEKHDLDVKLEKEIDYRLGDIDALIVMLDDTSTDDEILDEILDYFTK